MGVSFLASPLMRLLTSARTCPCLSGVGVPGRCRSVPRSPPVQFSPFSVLASEKEDSVLFSRGSMVYTSLYDRQAILC